ncbi:MAG: GatB/YqeY domain-containing protein [Archangium sp.]|nr:GatB/YqeY domain-containing protein [Archangium sp.]MDP3151721.1 GatB/YqeY domain-containing protein [Archangium sp.]MDP3573239.1 GatB/YqeY domain-containing protein [Archangium sp.]
MATLRERLDADLKDAMRAKDEMKLTTIRAIKSAVKYKEVEAANKVLDEPAIIQVIVTQVKQRRDAAAEYKAANRADLAEKEEKEIAILQNYLPTQLSAEQLTAEIAKAIAEAGAKSVKDLGNVMKIVTPRLKGQAEGKAISDEVKAQLGKLG